MSTVNYATTNLNVENDTDVDLTDKSNAQSAITAIDAAVSAAGSSLGTIGAAQSRLSFASANLATSIENLAASESTIRDVDMAYEMTNFTKTQIMLQAGTAMLAQANMAPQQVLSLFG
jgi:flagellin